MHLDTNYRNRDTDMPAPFLFMHFSGTPYVTEAHWWQRPGLSQHRVFSCEAVCN